jgi:hypothetical protein
MKRLWGQLLLVVPLCVLKGGMNLKYKPEQFELEETTIWSFKKEEIGQHIKERIEEIVHRNYHKDNTI